MADLKISQLTGASTPLAGTEVLPIVQSGSTVKVSVANLTAGRTQTSNGIVQGTAATGYNFTANTPAAGMTSQLLNWYEEGTFTPAVADADSGGNTATGTFEGRYTRIGRIVHFTIDLTNINTTGMTAGNTLVIRGLPFTASSTFNQYPFAVTWSNVGISLPTNGSVLGGTSFIYLFQSGSGVNQTTVKVSAISSGSGLIVIQGVYQV